MTQTNTKMDLVVFNKSSAYSPLLGSMVALRAVNPDFQYALKRPLEYLANHANPDNIGQPLYPRERVSELRQMRDNFSKYNMPEEQVREALGKMLSPGEDEGILDALDDDVEVLDEDAVRSLFPSGEESDMRRVAIDLVEAKEAISLPNSRRLSEETDPEQERNHETLRRLGFKDIVYVEEFPMLMMNVGYRRFANPGQMGDAEANLFPFVESRGTSKRPIYAEPYRTEAIVFELDPERVVAFIEDWSQRRVEAGNNVSPRFALQVVSSLHRDGAMKCNDGDPDLRNDRHGHDTWTLLHSLAHNAIASASGLCGFDATSLSEHILPGALRFAVLVNKTGNNSLGGLYALFHDLLDQYLERFETLMEECLHDPSCHDASSSACHACIVLSETTCRHMNSHLDRKIIFGDHRRNERTGYMEWT